MENRKYNDLNVLPIISCKKIQLALNITRPALILSLLKAYLKISLHLWMNVKRKSLFISGLVH